MRIVVSTLLIGLVAACASTSAVSVATPSPLTYEQLRARPLKLPAVATGQPCPASPVTMSGGVAPRVGSPLRLGFGNPVAAQAAYAFNKTVWDYAAPPWLRQVLLRGGRIDGQGELYFGGNGIGPTDVAGVAVTDAQGGPVLFFPELRLPVDSSAAFYLYPTTTGCYAIQADSDGFSEVIVFRAA